MWPPREDAHRARPSTPRLHDSVAPPVKMISPGFACRSAASLSRASSIAARAARPAAWILDGLPKCRLRYGSIASRAAAHNGWVAFFSTQCLSGPERARDERHALVKFHVRPDLRRLANDHSRAVVDEEMRADLRTRMNIDPRAAVRPLGHDARNQRHLPVEQMRHSINSDRLQRRISEDDFLVSGGGRVAFVSGIDVRPQHAAHRGQLLEKLRQHFLGFCFRCFIRRNFAEASANFSFESGMQMSDANARSIGEIF